MSEEVTTHSAEETTQWGREFAKRLQPPVLVLLTGDLGSGKTTLTKGIVAGLGAASEDEVTSPTFTLIHEYRGPHVNVYHVDLYRVDIPRQLETLGLDDLITENSVLLLEWGEKFQRFVDERDIEIQIDHLGEDERRIRILT